MWSDFQSALYIHLGARGDNRMLIILTIFLSMSCSGCDLNTKHLYQEMVNRAFRCHKNNATGAVTALVVMGHI